MTDEIKFPATENPRAFGWIRPHDEKITKPYGWVRPLWMGWRKPKDYTEEELEAFPQSFTCFYCLNQFPRKKLGGIEADQYVCRLCYPYTGEGWGRRLIKFSIWHNHPIRER